MYLFHLAYHIDVSKFLNTGTLYFWVETNQKINQTKETKTAYPFQLKKAELIKQTEDLFDGTNFKIVTQKLSIPYNISDEAIPSSLIANINNISDRTIKAFKEFDIYMIQIDMPIEKLKTLSFKSFYFEKNQKLANDAQFWINISKYTTNAIKQAQYVPDFIIEKNKLHPKYYHKWSFISSKLTEILKQQASMMPYSAYISADFNFNKSDVLNHYADNILNNLITNTATTGKIHKLVDGSIIADTLNLGTPTIDEEMWKQWKLWRNNLTYDQFGAPFQICFRLNAAQSKEGDDWNIEILMQAKDNPSFMVNAGEYWKTRKNKAEIYNKMFGTETDKNLLLQLGYASRVVPLIELFFKNHMSNNNISITTDLALQFLREDAWTLQASGYKIIVPHWWTDKGKLKAKIKLKAKRKSSGEKDPPKTYFDQAGLVSFNYKLAIGSHEVSKEEWQELMSLNKELVYFRGEWVELDIKEMQRVSKLAENYNLENDIGTIKDLLIKASDDELYDVELDDYIQNTLNTITGKTELKILDPPKALQATLRPYQQRGLSWMAFLEQIGLSPCLADDMGLGKTIQVISLLLSQPGSSPALLIAPTSVLGNWAKEIVKFAPSLNTFVHHGDKRLTDKIIETSLSHFDLMITSFSLCRRDLKLFQQVRWSRIIVDEAQNIKNPNTAQTKAICKLKSASRIALTGTPIENRLTDLWSIFHFLNPGYLGTKSYFKNNYEYPVQRDNNTHKTKMLKNLVEPFILRRLKTDKNIIQDLPDKIEQKVYCKLTVEQASIYQNIVNEVTEQIKNSKSELDKKALILSTLLKLKQTCNHPTQVLQDGSEFSAKRSMKQQRIVEMVSEIIASNESVLIFSQFTEICDQLNHYLQTKCGYNTYYIHGGTSRIKREAMINEFQDPQTQASIFILSLKAGGTGITLTKANHVIHFDRWWNPAIENQATDRAYRIGQNKSVFAYKFVTTGTIEEKIDKMIEDKQKVSDMIVGNDESWLSKLDSKSFIDLIKLSQDQITSDAHDIDEVEIYDE